MGRRPSEAAWVAVALVGAAVTIIVAAVHATYDAREQESGERVVPAAPWDAHPVLRRATLGEWRRAPVRDRTATSALFLKQYNPRWRDATADTEGFYEAASAHRNCVNAWTHKDSEYIGHLGGSCIVLDPEFTYGDFRRLDGNDQLDLESDMGPGLFGPVLANPAWDALNACAAEKLPKSLDAKPAYDVFRDCWRRHDVPLPPLKRRDNR